MLGPVRVSIFERIVPSLAFAVTAIGGAVGGAMLLRLLAALRQSENAGYAAVIGGVAEIEIVVAGVLIFAAALCAAGILVSAIRLFTTNKTASPPGLLFLMTGLLSVVPAFALHYVLHLIKEVLRAPDLTEGGISVIAGTITGVAWFAIGSAVVIALVMLAFSFIPFSSRAGRKSSPLVCLLLAEVFIAVTIGIYLYEARESMVERDKDRTPAEALDPSKYTGDSGIYAGNSNIAFADRAGSNSGSEGKKISGGVLNEKAISLPQPTYPAAARAVRATGAVSVQVLVDEGGNVVFATALSGHPLLRAAAVSAARQARFAPTKLSGKPVKVSGVLTYNFSEQ